MGPEERWWRDCAAGYRHAPSAWTTPRGYLLRRARQCDLAADLIALEGLTLGEVEGLRRLCRGEG